jgi:hypothetical protein
VKTKAEGERKWQGKNHRRPLFWVYKGPGETYSKLRPNSPRNSNLKGKRHLWQAKRASFHLRHDDRVKKGAPHRLNSYRFPLPLSLSCYRDRERGYFERDPSPRRKRAPSPPTDQGVRRLAPRKSSTAAPEHSGFKLITDQGFEGWPLGRVRQPPQSTRALRPLLIRGSKAGPSEGFDSRPRARRVRDDSGYVCYMAEARATLPRYPRTFPRPAGAIL